MSDERISVPEPPPGIGPGFLSDYWRSQEPLPTIEGFQVVWYYLQRGFQSMIALPMSNAITIFTIAISLFTLGGFLLVLQNIQNILESAGNTLYVTAYVKESAPESEVSDIIRELEANQRVRSVEFVTKKMALERFRSDLGSKASLLDGLDQENPLPASVDVVLQPDELTTDAGERLVASLRQKSVFDEVVFGSDWVERAQSVLTAFRIIALVSVVCALAVIIFLIGNTIKLVIYARRDELSIMQLVGASDTFVKVPFVIAGLLQGVVGSVLGLVLLQGMFGLIDSSLQGAELFGATIPEFSFLHLGSVIGIVLLGVAVGALGSFFALGRFMKL